MTPERRAAETADSQWEQAQKWTDEHCAEIRGRIAEADAAKLRKRAERQRRREAGYKRVECWLSPAAMEAVEIVQGLSERQKADIIESAVLEYGKAYALAYAQELNQ